MTKEEIIAIVQDRATQLGHAPTELEFYSMRKVSRRQVRRNFGTHRKMLAASGVEREGSGYPLTMRALFLDWAGIVRSLGKIPTVAEYEQHSKYSSRPLTFRFRYWLDVPVRMQQCALQEGLAEQWQDVLEIVARHRQAATRRATTSRTTSPPAVRPIIRHRSLDGRPAYGRPLPHSLLSYAPTNEAGVLVLFGSMARELGFKIQRVQTEFPDCEALREVEEDRWQRVRIEFEYESHSFLSHMHPAAECDLIVCWRHNWPECPLEVLELKKLAENCS